MERREGARALAQRPLGGLGVPPRALGGAREPLGAGARRPPGAPSTAPNVGVPPSPACPDASWRRPANWRGG